MKFSFRITAVALIVATVLVVFLSWGSDMIMWDDTSRLSTRKKPAFSPAPSFSKIQQVFNKLEDIKTFKEDKVHFNTSKDICAFNNIAPKVSDINSNEVLQWIDDGDRLGRDISKKKNYRSYLSNHTDLPLKVFVVPHSHSDPGWHKTVENYFYDQTSHTLNNMVEKLTAYPKMRFIWAESVFLSLWWDDLSEETRETVRDLVKKGQLEIVVGSWVVPDEASTHYFALIDQMIEGHQWLEKTIGVKPRNVWTLDPFGYSSTLPYLYKRAGYDNMVILRVHSQMKEILQNSQNLEFHWRQHWDSNNHTDIFTQMMPYMLYNIKHSCGPDPQVCLRFDFRRIPGEISESKAHTVTSNNIEELSNALVDQYRKKASLFKHNVLLVPIGDDFRFDRNIEWDQQYSNYQALFDYINSKKELNVQMQFGTIQEYFDEVQRTMKKLHTKTHEFFPSLSGDFFPYTDRDNEYWTGFYTTRPYDKTYGRELEVNLRNADILHTLASVMSRNVNSYPVDENDAELTSARQALGLFQHHDAITGTETAYVAADYEEKLRNAMEAVKIVLTSAAQFVLSKEKIQSPAKMDLQLAKPKSLHMVSPDANMLEIPSSNGLDLILFNSLARSKQELVEVVVDVDTVEVFSHSGDVITSQINPVWLSNDKISDAKFKLVFIAELEPMSLTTYHIKQSSSGKKPMQNYASHIKLYNSKNGGMVNLPENSRFQIRFHSGDSGIVLENDALKARFSSTTGFLQSVTSKPVFKTTKTELKFLMYKSRMSGAYLFGPAGPAVDGELEHSPLVRVIRGPVVSEIQVVQSLVNHTIRLCNSTGPLGSALQINNVVFLEDMDEKELIMRVDTDVSNGNGHFYTDLNGFQIMKRQRFTSLPPEANYYPMTTFAFMEDASTRMSLIGAQPLGVSSQASGSLEVMLDRRLLYDDNRGMGEGVRDTQRSPSRFYLLIEKPSQVQPVQTLPQASLLAHNLASDLRQYASVFFGHTKKDEHHLLYKAMSEPLACDVELVNLRKLSGVNSAALILHKVAYSCDFMSQQLLCPVVKPYINLHSMWSDVSVTSVTETTLSLMYKKSAVKSNASIEIGPMEINTYRVDFS